MREKKLNKLLGGFNSKPAKCCAGKKMNFPEMIVLESWIGNREGKPRWISNLKHYLCGVLKHCQALEKAQAAAREGELEMGQVGRVFIG